MGSSAHRPSVRKTSAVARWQSGPGTTLYRDWKVLGSGALHQQRPLDPAWLPPGPSHSSMRIRHTACP